jgi:hypothetical protein
MAMIMETSRMVSGCCGVWLLFFLLVNDATAFQFQFQFHPTSSHGCSGSPLECSQKPKTRQGYFSNSRLFMGKGLGGAKNKQAELAKKMALAKIQQQRADDGGDGANSDTSEASSPDAEPEKLSQEHSEFAQLLAKSPPPTDKKEPLYIENQDLFRKLQAPKPPTAVSTGPKVTSKDLKRKRKAAEARENNNQDPSEGTVVRLALGSTARRRDFEVLVEVETSKPLGPMRAASLVPWVPPFVSNYLVVLADPRRQSTDLYKSIQYLEAMSSSSTTTIAHHTISISADSVPEMIAWKKRNHREDTDKHAHVVVRMLEDPSLEWMKTYNCIHDADRWSLSVLVFDSAGIIRHHSREVDPSRVCQLVSEVVTTIELED